MNQVNFTENNKNLKTIIEEIMNEKASKNELTPTPCCRLGQW